MFGSFEEFLLAIAVQSGQMANDAAMACLAEFRARKGPSAQTIQQFLVERGLLTAEEVESLAAAARKALGAAEAAPPRQNPQEPIPGYAVLGKLGVGGTATVFLAEDRRHGNRRVALKILHPSKMRDGRTLAGFVREAELLVEFDHPNLVKGYVHGRHGPLVYLAMEYMDGETVQQILEREKRLSEARSLEIILETAKALDYTQAHGIVHRDIKPGNIMVLKDGRIKLCDLGFALPIGEAGAGQDETTSGTAQYMSPEQARGQRGIDVRADIYSLGASLYHMVMGELPFTGGDSLEVMAKQVMEALNSSEIKNRRISKHMHYFIERMMSKEKDLRYATPAGLIEDINQQIEGFRSLEYRPQEAPAEERQPLDPARGRPPTRRQPPGR